MEGRSEEVERGRRVKVDEGVKNREGERNARSKTG